MALHRNALTVCVIQFLGAASATAYDDSYYYEGSGEESFTFPGSSCRYDSDCSTQYCCRESMTCCEQPYRGVTTSCRHRGLYTGLSCPPSYDPNRIYCCYEGHRCCSNNIGMPYSRPDGGKGSIEKTGVSSIGAIAGFVFLAVIIVGTLLTLATRYIKIKVRREHRRAGIESQAYLDAVNRRSNSPGDNQNQNPTTTNNNSADVPNQSPDQQSSGVFFIHLNHQEEEDQDDDESGPPPSYDEAMATCPRVEDRRTRLSPDRNFQFRPPMRPNRRQQANMESIPLSVRKDNYDPIQTSSAAAERADTAFVTLPKEEDSQA